MTTIDPIRNIHTYSEGEQYISYEINKKIKKKNNNKTQKKPSKQNGNGQYTLSAIQSNR